MTRSMTIVVASAFARAVAYWGFRSVGSSNPHTSTADTHIAHAVDAAPNVGTPVHAPASPAPGSATAADTTSVTPAKPSAAGVALDIVIAQGAAAPFQTLKVSKGDVVAVSVDSDQAGKLEVHGYRKELEVTPHAKASITFAVDRSGRFPIDLHGEGGAHIEAAALEVMPR